MNFLLLLVGAALSACSSPTQETTVSSAPVRQEQVTQPVGTTPDFNADSAYYYTEQQVAFGPRVPNTKAHKQCADYLAASLRRFGAKVYEQDCRLKAYDNTILEARNIIGSFNPESQKRIMLLPIGTPVPMPIRNRMRPTNAKPAMGQTMEPVG